MRFLLILILSSILFLGIFRLAQAEIQSPISAQSLEELLNSIIDFLFYLGIVIAPLMIIYGAFLFITARGDPSQINRGKNVILYTLVALAIMFLAEGLLSVIRGALGG